jgi:hypothetical protein
VSLPRPDKDLIEVDLSGARIVGDLTNARISGLIDGLTVNDVEVGPLIAAELDRRYPERTRLRPWDQASAKVAWSVVEDLWSATKARASGLPEDLLRARVDGEWSFLETMRHLVFVTEVWVREPLLGRTDKHPLALAPTFVAAMSDHLDVPLADVVAAREDRMAAVRAVIDDDTRFGKRAIDHLLVVLDEEWHHNWFANRDLDKLAP